MNPRTRRVALVGLIGLVALPLLVGAGVLLYVHRSIDKERLQAAASKALGLQVGIEGDVAVAFFPALRLTLGQVRLRNGDSEVLSARQAVVAIGLRSLFGDELTIDKIVLEQPTITLTRQHEGRFNVGPAQATEAPGDAPPARDGPDLSFAEGTVVYADDRFGKPFVANDCRAEVRRVRQAAGHAGGRGVGAMQRLSFTADLRCGQVQKDGLTLADLVVKVDATDGVVALDPLAMRIFGAPAIGRVRADFSSPVPAYSMTLAVPQFPIESFVKTAAMKPIGTGRMDFSAQLSTKGKSVPELRQALQGTLSLRGKGLVFSGSDLDGALDRFESSQTFNLVDVGAVFLAGPLGLLVTKGYDFAALSMGTEGGRSEIRTLVSEWKVEHGVAQARDVALATARNRLALQGRLDLVNDRFDDVTLAVIDANGCAAVRQRILGTFLAPVVERPNLLRSLAGPALRLLRRGSDLVRGETCDVFYAGSVAAPK